MVFSSRCHSPKDQCPATATQSHSSYSHQSIPRLPGYPAPPLTPSQVTVGRVSLKIAGQAATFPCSTTHQARDLLARDQGCISPLELGFQTPPRQTPQVNCLGKQPLSYMRRGQAHREVLPDSHASETRQEARLTKGDIEHNAAKKSHIGQRTGKLDAILTFLSGAEGPNLYLLFLQASAAGSRNRCKLGQCTSFN